MELGGTFDSTPPLTCGNTVPTSTLSPRGLRSVPLGAASRRHSILARALLARRAADGEVLGVLVEPAGTPPEGLESEARSTNGGTMRRFVIERDIPDIGSAEREQLRAAAGQSNAVLRAMQSEGKHIQWEHSYVAGDKTFCIYVSDDPEMIDEHAERSGFPATVVTEIGKIIDPTTEKA